MARVEPRPGGAPARPGMDAALRGFARFVLGLLFREVELVGAEHLPDSGPVIAIANHYNSIMDGAVLLAYLPRIPRFLAASTVWDYKPVAPFMNAGGSVKVFRRQDGRANEGSLEDSFADAAQLLADGGVLAVFPEGRSHDDPALLAFKTGTARIARFTLERYGEIDLAIVPVGIDYEVKNRFRTRVCFTFGPPVPPRRDAGGAVGGAGSVADHAREATGQMRRALAEVAPDFADADEARALTLGGAILALTPGRPGERAPGFGRIVAARREIRAWLARAGATEAAEVRHALAAYLDRLAEVGLADHELAAPPTGAALSRSAVALVAGLPVALVALLFSYPQSVLLRAVAGTKERDKQLTWITFGGLVVYGLSWSLWALVLGFAVGAGAGAGWGWLTALAVLVAAPLSLFLSLPTLDRGRCLARAIRARRILRRDPASATRLAALRDEARAALDKLRAAAAKGSG